MRTQSLVIFCAAVIVVQSPVNAQTAIKVKSAPTFKPMAEDPLPLPLSESTFGPRTDGDSLPPPPPRAAISVPQHSVAPVPPSPAPAQERSSVPANPLPLPGAPQTVSPTIPPVPTEPLVGSYSEYIDEPIASLPCGDCQPPMFRRDNGILRVNTPLTFHMLDFQNRQTDKEVRLLEDARRGAVTPSITIGAQLRASALYGRTNTADKFPYLGRFPTDFVGNTATDARLLHSNQAMVLHANSWAHGYVETLFSDVFSFQAAKQGSLQVRQAYVLLGDLNYSPFYAFLGKKNVSFGDMSTLSPFSQAIPWHYFAGLAEGGGIGYSANGLRGQVMALTGGRGIRVVDSKEKGHINNFAANIRYDAEVSDSIALGIGAGYLHGTIYDTAVPEHVDATAFGPRNGAWDINGSVHVGALRLAGEFVQTEEAWPASGRRVSAWRAEAAYDFFYGDMPCVLSGSFGEGNQGADGTEFEFNRQLVIGLRVQPSPNAFFTFEYVRSTGFAPLINLTTVSDRDVEQNSAIAGVVIAI